MLKILKVNHVDVSQVKHWQNDPDARTKEEANSQHHPHHQLMWYCTACSVLIALATGTLGLSCRLERGVSRRRGGRRARCGSFRDPPGERRGETASTASMCAVGNAVWPGLTHSSVNEQVDAEEEAARRGMPRLRVRVGDTVCHAILGNGMSLGVRTLRDMMTHDVHTLSVVLTCNHPRWRRWVADMEKRSPKKGSASRGPSLPPPEQPASPRSTWDTVNPNPKPRRSPSTNPYVEVVSALETVSPTVLVPGLGGAPPHTRPCRRRSWL